ncbi:hypothetical protein BOTBODRAFT_27711 [Botryobasidium botryosum FD-172 SS1]|uniref:RFX-type winged-helix domain-containing protein n=1 Tax=Botryobasidium botryosum (strain FD-172 SS1) TaxID=930990 RepID=A0A067N028_BOTB1|nr:hypothetical protein BOTBODRAFT_27711 [Botryobasidium botryosum FD-172 SS1]
MSYSTEYRAHLSSAYRGAPPAAATAPAAAPPRRHVVSPPDASEQWYLEPTPSNRMVLALRSGIDDEVSWALLRLANLSNEHGHRFNLAAIPGLTDALFLWPQEFIAAYREEQLRHALFAPTTSSASCQKHAVESLLVLRNASLLETNATHLFNHSRMIPTIADILSLPDIADAYPEFLYYALELLQSLAPNVVLPAPDSADTQPIPLSALYDIAKTTTDRTMLIAVFSALTLILSHPSNVSHTQISSISPAILVLPLSTDTPLLTAALDYIFTVLMHPPAAKAFLLRLEMPSTVKMLVALLKAEQPEEIKEIPIGPPIRTDQVEAKREDYVLTEEDKQRLIPMAEPERSFDWMGTVFEFSAGAEQTQVTFWTLYRDTFTPYADQQPLLPAAEIIKNVTIAFPQSQAMVLPGDTPRFIIQNIRRRARPSEADRTRFKCRWERETCQAGGTPFSSPDELYAHLLGHLDTAEPAACAWGTCAHPATSLANLRGHILTHLPPPVDPPKHPSQPSGITLSASQMTPEPLANPIAREPPPPPKTTLKYSVARAHAPSTTLTALLILRLVFHAAFPRYASADAPGEDDERFGFPEIPASAGNAAAGEQDGGADAAEDEGERRGQRAFESVRTLLTGVKLADDALMGWIAEMISAVGGIGGE